MDGMPIDTGLKWLPHLAVQPLLGQLIVALALVAVAFLARDAFRSWLADRAAARLGTLAETDIRKQLVWLEEHLGGRLERLEISHESLRSAELPERMVASETNFRMAISEWGAALAAVKAEVDTKIQHAQTRVDGSVAAVHELGTSSWRKPG